MVPWPQDALRRPSSAWVALEAQPSSVVGGPWESGRIRSEGLQQTCQCLTSTRGFLRNWKNLMKKSVFDHLNRAVLIFGTICT